jgi:1,4-alpha-glucan branching enzyme
VDGLRVDAVASMLYLDYARQEGAWIPNREGGKENLEAIDFLRRMNESVYREHPDVMTIAEESTAWPMVSRPTSMGGLGFGMKWNMGWMHDTLAFMKEDPIHRRYHLDKLTFSLVYAFNENFVLPLSHDEVVYGKGSLFGRMPGDEWQKFANLRLLLAIMWTHPGKKLLFMGGEFGQRSEWAHEGELDWGEAQADPNRGVQRLVGELNALYRHENALHEIDFAAQGFEWVENRDAHTTVISFLRKPRQGPPVLVVCNLTPVPRNNYQLGVPAPGRWRELLNTDSRDYGGSGWGNLGGVESAPITSHGRRHTLTLTLPPLAVLVLKPEA